MFSLGSASYATMSEEKRAALAELLARRNAYNAEVMKLNELKIRQLMNPTADGQAQIEAFNSTVVAPLRNHMSTAIAAVIEDAIDLEKLQSMLPMVAMALLQGIDLPYLMEAFGFDPDMVTKLLGQLKKFMSSGMDDLD